MMQRLPFCVGERANENAQHSGGMLRGKKQWFKYYFRASKAPLKK